MLLSKLCYSDGFSTATVNQCHSIYIEFPHIYFSYISFKISNTHSSWRYLSNGHKTSWRQLKTSKRQMWYIQTSWLRVKVFHHSFKSKHHLHVVKTLWWTCYMSQLENLWSFPQWRNVFKIQSSYLLLVDNEVRYLYDKRSIFGNVISRSLLDFEKDFDRVNC